MVEMLEKSQIDAKEATDGQLEDLLVQWQQ